MFARNLIGVVTATAIVTGATFTAQAGETEVAKPTVLAPTGTASRNAGSAAVEKQPLSAQTEGRDLKDDVGETLASWRAGLAELVRSLTDF